MKTLSIIVAGLLAVSLLAPTPSVATQAFPNNQFKQQAQEKAQAEAATKKAKKTESAKAKKQANK